MKISHILLLCGGLLSQLHSIAQTDTTASANSDSTIITTPPLTAADTTIRYRINGTYLLSAWQDLKYSVSRPVHWKGKDFVRLGIVVGGAGALMAADYEIKQAFLSNRQTFWTSVTNEIEPFGNTYSPFLVGGMYLTGVVTKNRQLEHTSLMTAKSLLISTMIYTFAKSIIRRGRPTYFDDPFVYQRPYLMDKKYTSFPSGHMLTVTSVATALAEAYGEEHPWVPYVSYGIAILTGTTRLYQVRHWSSDVWVGASLGYFVTKGIFKRHKALEHKKAMAAMAAAAGR
ncbi:phosphatase PAP2 family protein [Chitinophaga tropicalis]|uniref:Phosphatase PAP2 family protein n=1 Tax=Chitinophaga tropicalis TaxID=2683588 RepID=A0A7K1U2W5_9BACT|nr:phosphatase PAP2 family protein [Chitinophaga tropicalis]MVT08660.1 phosphatase PAP2 family protein [Chitinophaga tropicalis]